MIKKLKEIATLANALVAQLNTYNHIDTDKPVTASFAVGTISLSETHTTDIKTMVAEGINVELVEFNAKLADYLAGDTLLTPEVEL